MLVYKEFPLTCLSVEAKDRAPTREACTAWYIRS